MGFRGLDQLRVSMLDYPAGTWWMLLESDTRFSEERVQHPWVFHVAYSARFVFAHGCPRTRRRSPTCEHAAHPLGHQPMCQLSDRGWVLPAEAQQIKGEWLDSGFYSCEEPSGSGLLAEIAALLGGSDS
jgi:hypothetical protein